MIQISECAEENSNLCTCMSSSLCVLGGAAALLIIRMSNDIFPDWAITTSTHLLKKGWKDEVDDTSGTEEITCGPNSIIRILLIIK